ncbi:MAG: helix-turn-helix transcriptional regulator [Candidatus Acidiferrum sp.]
MDIADKLRRLREAKHLSQGDIQKRTGLFRSYISRIENGFTVPSIETLEKITRALEIEMYQLFYGEENATAPLTTPDGTNKWLFRRIGRNYLRRMTHALSKMSGRDRAVLLYTAGIMARERNAKPNRNLSQDRRNKRSIRKRPPRDADFTEPTTAVSNVESETCHQ